jgi:DNA primase
MQCNHIHITFNNQNVIYFKTGEYGDYDFFRDRLMFPIHNSKGGVIAFGGRAFDNKAKAKYLNSQESPIFFKSREQNAWQFPD